MYLDPNFGSMIIQLLVGLLAGVTGYAFAVKSKLFGVFSRKQNGKDVQDNLQTEVTNENKGV